MKKSWAEHCSSDEESEGDRDVPGSLPHEKQQGRIPALSEVHDSEKPHEIAHHDDDVVVVDDDDDDDDEDSSDGVVVVSGATSQQQPHDDEDRRKREPHPQGPPPAKEYVYPEHPPFTAYVGNLAFAIKQPDELASQMVSLVEHRINKEIKIVKARVATDRNSGLQRGFGYVEVETVEDLKAIMEINDGQSIIAGRPIKLDVAQPPSSSGNRRQGGHQGGRGGSGRGRGDPGAGVGSDIDGTQFRGGRYTNRRASESDLPNPSSSSSSSDGNSNATPQPPSQRKSLVLKPRSQPLRNVSTTSEASEGGGGGDSSTLSSQQQQQQQQHQQQPTSTSSGSQSDIFGGAKARENQDWESRRQSTSKRDLNDSERSRNSRSGGRSNAGGGGNRDGSGRGGGRGGGGGGGGRGGGSGRGGRGPNSNRRQSSSNRSLGSHSPNNNTSSNKKDDQSHKKGERIDGNKRLSSVSSQTSKRSSQPETAKAPANKFSLLNFDDSDSD